MALISISQLKKLFTLLWIILIEFIIQVLLIQIKLDNNNVYSIMLCVITLSSIIAIILSVVYQNVSKKKNNNINIDIPITSLGDNISNYFFLFLNGVFETIKYFTYYETRRIGYSYMVNYLYMESSIKLSIFIISIPAFILLFKMKFYIHHYIAFVIIVIGIVLSGIFAFVGANEDYFDLSSSTLMLRMLLAYSGFGLLSNNAKKYMLTNRKANDIPLYIFQAIIGCIFTVYYAVGKESKSFIEELNKHYLIMIVLSIALSVSMLMKNIIINQFSVLPLTINEGFMYIFYLMYLKLNDKDQLYEFFFSSKDYYVISFILILIGSIILNEILVIPCFGLDSHTEEKMLEEKILKDIDNIDHTQLNGNELSNDKVLG